uniref:RRM domain-containing protein n=1 Tax=Hanusia phi TaxID=3032 RepID=A0A7S0EE45_9CRYP|mmetsp:Transcript_22608/g.50935  ORF Transcript_22608/g.50935 Transcript_22608/m.50935 type:complete len:392 (+) Transcript_22608:326-1501(+)
MDQDTRSGASGSQHTSPSSAQPPHSNVYVKNLAEDMDDNSLRELFEGFGVIKSACVMLDQATKKSRNFGFVKFVEIESAQAAIQALNNTELQGKKLMVKFADADAEDKPPGDQCPSDNLYVKGFPPSITQDDIFPIFSRLGNVIDIKILSRPGVGSTGKALVRMENSVQASWAISELNGKVLEGCSGPVVVRYADSPDEKQNKRKNNLKRNDRFAGSPQLGEGYPMPMMAMQDPFRAPPFLHGPPMARAPEICNLYVNELPSEADDLFLYRNFAPFGAITSVRVMRDENGNSRGFGFVKFVHAHDAYMAMSSLNGKQVNGKYLHVSPKTTSKGQANQFPPEFPLSPSVPPHPMLGHCVPLPQPPQPMMGHMGPFAITGMHPGRHIMPTTSL